MSLATSTAGGFSGGGAGALSTAAMAHNTAPALHQQHTQYQHTQIPSGGGAATTGLPMTNVALGADLLDKNQKMLSGKSVRGAARMPVVAVDLWGEGSSGRVAYFPPMEEDGEL